MNKSKLAGILCVLFFIAGGFWIPAILLDYNSQKNMSVCKLVPEKYYLASETAMAKKASEQLTALDRMHLVSGTWDSSYIQVSTDEGSLSETEIVEITKDKLKLFYKQYVYPYNLESSYDNWYSWDTELYKYTDDVFCTYTVYLWVVHFTKYDNSIKHTILITENGTILAAEVNNDSKSYSSIQKLYSNLNINNLMGDPSIRIANIIEYDDINISGYPFINTTDIDFDKLYRIELSDKRNDIDYYYIYQYKTDGKYGIGIIPAD